jgi:hypothetical protein
MGQFAIASGEVWVYSGLTMTRYGVYTHGYGRPIVQRGPVAGCADFPKHQHTLITPRPVGLKRAKELVDAQPVHAQVVPWQESGTVYENDKLPYTPEGWTAELWRGGRV